MPGVWVFPGGGVDPRRRRRTKPATGPARCASWRRRRRSRCRPTRSWCCSRAGSPRRSSRAASTPGSSSPWPPPTRRPSRTGSRPPRPAGSSRAAALEAQAAGELALAFPTVSQLRVAAALPHLRRGARRPPRPRVEPILPKVIGTTRTTGSSSPATPTTPPEQAQNWLLVRAADVRRRAGVAGSVVVRRRGVQTGFALVVVGLVLAGGSVPRTIVTVESAQRHASSR